MSIVTMSDGTLMQCVCEDEGESGKQPESGLGQTCPAVNTKFSQTMSPPTGRADAADTALNAQVLEHQRTNDIVNLGAGHGGSHWT